MRFKIALILIIFLAVFLRLENIWYMEFKADEAINLFLAKNFINKGHIPLAGIQSSIGTYTSPLFIYLIAIPFAFSRSPVLVVGYIALLNAIAVYLCFLFCAEFFNKRAALIATAFFALNPWAILYSRKIWNQDLLSPFIILFFYSIYKIIIKKESKYIILSFIALSILTQIHQQTLSYLLIFALALLFFKPVISLLYYLSGIACFILLYLPYILFDVHSSFYNLKIFFVLSKRAFNIYPAVFIYPFTLATGVGFPGLSSAFLSVICLFLPLLSVIFLLYNIGDKRCRILLLWFLVPILSAFISKIPVYRHYFISLFPVQFIACGIFVDAFATWLKKNNCRDYLIFTFTIILIGIQLACSLNFFGNYIRNQPNIPWNGYGPPFRYRLEEVKRKMAQGYAKPEVIHEIILRDKPNRLKFKYDFLATRYIVDNINDIKAWE